MDVDMELIPWKVYGRYENESSVGYDDHQVAHVDFGSITYEYKQGGKADGDPVQRRFVLQEMTLDTGDVVTIEALEHSAGATKREFHFRREAGAVAGQFRWVLSHNGSNPDIKKNGNSPACPFAVSFWVFVSFCFGSCSILGPACVFFSFCLFVVFAGVSD